MSTVSASQKVLNTSALASSISAFLTPDERSDARTSVQNRLFSAAIAHPPRSVYPPQWNPQSFAARFGEVFRSETNLNVEARRIEEQEKVATWISNDGIPVSKGDHFVFQSFNQGSRWERLMKQVRHYTGYEYALLMKNFGMQTDRKLTQFDELQNSALPQPTIAAVRDRCIRGLTISKELKGLEAGAQKMQRMLDAQTQKLPWLVRKVCAAVQALVFFFLGTHQHVQKLVEASASMKKEGGLFSGDTGRLEDLRRGKNRQSPDNYSGIKIGTTTQMVKNQQETYGIYVLPVSSFTGTVAIVLSKNGKDPDGVVDQLYFQWNASKSVLGASEYCCDNYGTLSRRHLFCYGVTDYVGREPATEDRPMMRILGQVLAEVLLRSGENTLKYSNSHADADVFICCGFKMDTTDSWDVAKQNMITQAVREAREAGRRFPAYKDRSGFHMYLRNKNGSLLDERVDFGDGDPSTWREMIQRNPILPKAEGNFMPDFWLKDPRPYEVNPLKS